jgi:hypothetical protein
MNHRLPPTRSKPLATPWERGEDEKSQALSITIVELYSLAKNAKHSMQSIQCKAFFDRDHREERPKDVGRAVRADDAGSMPDRSRDLRNQANNQLKPAYSALSRGKSLVHASCCAVRRLAHDGGCLSGMTPFQASDFLSPNYRTRVIDTPSLAASERTGSTAITVRADYSGEGLSRAAATGRGSRRQVY